MTAQGTADAQQTPFELPPLEIKSISNGFIAIRHVILPNRLVHAISQSDVKVSTRRKETAYKLSDGQTIIITSNKNTLRPENVDGLLFKSENGELSWISHILKKKIEDQITTNGLASVANAINKEWDGQFLYSGKLRPPQIGSLHAIGSHWSTQHTPATVVLPTGTGKTETILATLVAFTPGTTLITVPTRALKDQAANKLLTLGLLRELGHLNNRTKNPIVGIVKRRPKSADEINLFKSCNVIVGTMSALAGGTAKKYFESMASNIDTLIVDEAHHIPAKGWSEFRDKFAKCKLLQFTATPFRRDGKLVEGRVIYDYPLRLAQQDGYFKPILFKAVYSVEDEAADRVIASEAINVLRQDMASGKDHILMARCSSLSRATKLQTLYASLAPDLNPVSISSESDTDTKKSLDLIDARESRIIVCVNMLGEGYDLPQLKIAAIHDTHKSLAVLLQFIGRFTRTNNDLIGDATVIANIADIEVSYALERLYSEDADWNILLSEMSSAAAQNHARLIDFLRNSVRLDPPRDGDEIDVSNHFLSPTFNTLIFNAPSYEPKQFTNGVPQGMEIYRVWLNSPANTLYFVTRTKTLTKWTRSQEVSDYQWNLFVLHYDNDRKLLYLGTSDKSALFESIAKSVGATDLISGDTIFKSLGHINRLIFQNVGVKKHGRRNLGYALYTGTDVVQALSISERSGSVKSNLSGTGWEGGRPVTIGCSFKGRIWSREKGTIPEYIEWCRNVGAKLQDTSIDTSRIIENILIPEEVFSLPDKQILSIEWPIELLYQSEERAVLKRGGVESPISMFGMDYISTELHLNLINFRIRSVDEEKWGEYALIVGGTNGFSISRTSDTEVKLKIGNFELSLEEYLSNYPPLIRFVDLSELNGNILVKPQNPQDLTFPSERFEIWDWSGIDITKESIFKNGEVREDSIQWYASSKFIRGGFELVFDDDGAGEAADLVCMKEEPDHIRLVLVHCKFTTGTTSGTRIKDVVEVASQAVRSAKWKWKFKDLCRHISQREKRLSTATRHTRFLAGSSTQLNKFARLVRFKEIRPEIIIVQPGLSQQDVTPDQKMVLASAYSYLKETIGADLDVVCSQ